MFDYTAVVKEAEETTEKGTVLDPEESHNETTISYVNETFLLEFVVEQGTEALESILEFLALWKLALVVLLYSSNLACAAYLWIQQVKVQVHWATVVLT